MPARPPRRRTSCLQSTVRVTYGRPIGLGARETSVPEPHATAPGAPTPRLTGPAAIATAPALRSGDGLGGSRPDDPTYCAPVSERQAALRSALGRVGVWSSALQTQAAPAESAALDAYGSVGYRATWIPEGLGSKEVFAHAGVLLAGSRRMLVATGIANIYARDPMAMANGARALVEAYPGRFLLGIGVSHAQYVAVRGSVYERPVTRMRAYLDAMEAASYSGPPPADRIPLVLAALGPRMLELAAERTDGAHPYFVPVEHTAMARARIGAEPLLLVELTAVLDTDPVRARDVARAFASRYLTLPNYAENLRRLGYGDHDLTGGGSDRLLDAVVVQGDADAIARRVRAHLDAGADHVCVQLRSAEAGDLCLEGYREVAASLTDLMVG
jgi:probable F420-dependent oxidoreductase